MKIKKTDYTIETLDNLMSLRRPQAESLEILGKIADIRFKEKTYDSITSKVHELYPIFKEFERSFPDFSFSLATGVGKTLLMGAFITYLYTNYGIKNFFIIAPNLTIYNKLIEDFGSPNSKKYVFKRIGAFTKNPPTVITGDTYKDEIAGQTILNHSITINIFNIGKINSEMRGGKLPQIKRLSEYLGESYFEYLAGLEDLVVLMDESHHYRADRGMAVINELDPVLGLEVTATPQVEKGNKTVKFRNVVYEYSLAKAIAQGYVKEPAVATRSNFDPKKYSPDELDRIKLKDGIRIHRNTKTELELYAQNENEKLVKPFVLVVCKDTNHANEVKDYILSDDFFDGYYKDKVIEVHSNQSGEEKEDNIQKLMSLESPDNKIEIVIHVNMLKEGWDVNNLYTIIPLRTAVSMTLREQTIGRGLRLPYGKRTGNEAVDRLTIVSHDKFNEIVEAANEESSIIKRENIILVDDDNNFENEKEISRSETLFDNDIRQKEKKLKYARSEQKIKEIKRDIAVANAVGEAINDILDKPIDLKIGTLKTENPNSNESVLVPQVEDNKVVVTSRDLAKPEIQKIITEKANEKLKLDTEKTFDSSEMIAEKISQAVSPLCEQKIKSSIDIPDVIVYPKETQKLVFENIDLNTSSLYVSNVSDDIIIETLGKGKSSTLQVDGNINLPESPENLIFYEILNNNPDIDYEANEELIYKLISQAIRYLKQGRSENDFNKVILYYKKDIAREIYNQMSINSKVATPEYAVEIRKASSKILSHGYSKYKEDEISDYKASVAGYEIKNKVFDYYNKACHTEYKFDSVPEQLLAIVLEKDPKVLKWLRPANKQFNIIWREGNRYNPDFVVETDDTIYIIEVKSYKTINDEDVKAKESAALKYCEFVNVYGEKYKNKRFEYLLVPAEDIKRSSTFDSIVAKNYKH